MTTQQQQDAGRIVWGETVAAGPVWFQAYREAGPWRRIEPSGGPVEVERGNILRAIFATLDAGAAFVQVFPTEEAAMLPEVEQRPIASIGYDMDPDDFLHQARAAGATIY